MIPWRVTKSWYCTGRFLLVGAFSSIMKVAHGDRKPKKGFGKLMKWLGAVYFFNTVFPLMQQSVFYSNFLPKQIQSKSVVEKGGLGNLDLKNMEPYFLGPGWSLYKSGEKRTLGWLVHANSLAESLLDPGSPPAFYGLEKCVELGIGDCVQYAQLTYSKFFALADKLSLSEMRDNVRLVQGKKCTMGIWGGHMWLEINILGEWVPYEPSCVLRTKNGLEVEPVVFLDDGLLGNPLLYERRYLFQIDSSGRTCSNVEVMRGLLDFKGLMGTVINNYRIKKAEKNERRVDTPPRVLRNNVTLSDYHKGLDLIYKRKKGLF